MRKLVLFMVVIGTLAGVTANAFATPTCVPNSSANVAPLYCVPPATSAAAAHDTAGVVASYLATLTPGALAARGAVRLHGLASGPGTLALVLSARIKGRIVVLAKGSASAHGPGAVDVALKLTKAGKLALAHAQGKLKLTVKATFRPSHGKAKSFKSSTSLK